MRYSSVRSSRTWSALSKTLRDPAELGLGAIGVGQFVENEFGLVGSDDVVARCRSGGQSLLLTEQGEQRVFRNDLRVRGGPTEFGGREGFGTLSVQRLGSSVMGNLRVPVWRGQQT